MLSNINADKYQILQLILVGQLVPVDFAVGSKTPSIAQRISSDFHLKSLDAAEVTKYVDFRLHAVGAATTVFTQEACSEIAYASGGIPRMINILCDTALVYGFASAQKTISAALVKEVIADKQQYSIFPVRGRLQKC
jgi:type II secretory pathway predicted ATPase ExeA